MGKVAGILYPTIPPPIIVVLEEFPNSRGVTFVRRRRRRRCIRRAGRQRSRVRQLLPFISIMKYSHSVSVFYSSSSGVVCTLLLLCAANINMLMFCREWGGGLVASFKLRIL